MLAANADITESSPPCIAAASAPGAVVHYMLLVGTIDLAAILLLSAVHAVRCGPRAIVEATGTPVQC